VASSTNHRGSGGTTRAEASAARAIASALASSCWLVGALPAAASAVAAAWSAMRRRTAVSVMPGRAAAAWVCSKSATGWVMAVKTPLLRVPASMPTAMNRHSGSRQPGRGWTSTAPAVTVASTARASMPAAAIASMGSPACSHPAARRTFCTSVSRNGPAPSLGTKMPSSTSRATSGSVTPARSASPDADSSFMSDCLVAVLGQSCNNIGADEPGAADDHDVRHAEPSTCALIGNGLLLVYFRLRPAPPRRPVRHAHPAPGLLFESTDEPRAPTTLRVEGAGQGRQTARPGISGWDDRCHAPARRFTRLGEDTLIHPVVQSGLLRSGRDWWNDRRE
jgi:hypothetical protein